MAERAEPGGATFSDLIRPKDVVGDALLLATAAVRIAVKNLLIVRALRDGADYEQEWWLGAVAREFELIAAEKDADAERLEAVREASKRKRGRATHPGDFRATDAPVLKRRIRILRKIAERLRAVSTDEAALLKLVAEARTAALDEITTARHDPGRGPTADPVERASALAELAEDLAALTAAREVAPPTTRERPPGDAPEGRSSREAASAQQTPTSSHGP